MKLFHFSEDSRIERFIPRPVAIPAERAPGRKWLNGPLVWAIEEAWHGLYFFPRDCPRILLVPTAATTMADRAQWFGDSPARMIAYVEQCWMARLSRTVIFRYAFDRRGFESLNDAGAWVSREIEIPTAMERFTSLPVALAIQEIELRPLESLLPLVDVWSTSSHVSGIWLRNARAWPAPLQPFAR